ncbi:MAG: hypothetical protein H0X62_16390, partial [Bacteroidetes bacterium]|nr:hypothetical protein [Bacteroidota bacterium]
MVALAFIAHQALQKPLPIQNLKNIKATFYNSSVYRVYKIPKVMKQFSTVAPIIAFFAFFMVEQSYGTHALPLIGLQGNWNGTTLTVTGSSDSPTCHNTVIYYMDVQIFCPTSGSVMFNQDVNMGPKPDCALVAYPTNVLSPMAALCPGKTYSWRARER